MTTERSLRHAARWCGAAAVTMAASMGLALIDTAQAAPPSTWTVCPGVSICDYETIQGAIDDDTNVLNGDTIDVGPGTYNETVTIDKALFVLGEQALVDPVSPSGRSGGESVISATYPVTIASNDVVFDGFEIINFKVAVRTTGTFDNIEVAHNWIHDADSEQTAQQGVLLEPDLITNFRIDNNIIETSVGENSLAAIGIGGSGTDPAVVGLDITGNSIGVSENGLYSDPGTAADVAYLDLLDNHFHDTAATTMSIGNTYAAIVTGNVFEDVVGSIGTDGSDPSNSEISGNTFTAGGYLDILSPTADIDIRNNLFTDEVSGQAITIQSGTDASAMHIWANGFLDASIDIDLVSNLDDGTADMTLNWWDHPTGAADHTGSILGDVDTNPWIASYTEDTDKVPPTDWPLGDLALSRPVGFWPLVDTETTITDDTPDPTFVGGLMSAEGTVEITGLGGDTTGITPDPLAGRVDVGNGTDECDDTNLSATATNLLFDFSCSVATTAASSTSLSATYHDDSEIRFYNDSTDTEGHDVFEVEELDITFDGEFFDADGFGTTRLLATIDGGTDRCESGIEVTFTVSPAVGTTIIVTATSGLDGTAATTSSLPVGVYEVVVSAEDTDGCIYTDGVGTIVVFNRDAATTGGGWYKVDASPPRVNFGYTAQVKVNRRLDTTTVSGQLLWTHQGTNRLRGAITGYYVPVGCPEVGQLQFTKCARLIGTGTLYDYNSDTERWINPRVVTFEVWVADGGQASLARRGGPKQSKPDAFGISINGETVEGESVPAQLNGGNLQIR